MAKFNPIKKASNEIAETPENEWNNFNQAENPRNTDYTNRDNFHHKSEQYDVKQDQNSIAHKYNNSSIKVEDSKRSPIAKNNEPAYSNTFGDTKNINTNKNRYAFRIFDLV